MGTERKRDKRKYLTCAWFLKLGISSRNSRWRLRCPDMRFHFTEEKLTQDKLWCYASIQGLAGDFFWVCSNKRVVLSRHIKKFKKLAWRYQFHNLETYLGSDLFSFDRYMCDIICTKSKKRAFNWWIFYGLKKLSCRQVSTSCTWGFTHLIMSTIFKAQVHMFLKFTFWTEGEKKVLWMND